MERTLEPAPKRLMDLVILKCHLSLSKVITNVLFVDGKFTLC